jgi:hypothetical protein
VFVVADANMVAVYSRAPLAVPASHRAAVAELIVRSNWESVVGSLELDYADGEIRFRTSVDVEDVALSQQLLVNLVRDNVIGLDEVLPALRAVAAGQAEPADALATAQRRG